MHRYFATDCFFFFTETVINIWNKLHTPTVDFKSLSYFKKTISDINFAELIGPC